MVAGPLISDDQRCTSCGYNLRGLTLDRNCPECGEPACHSVRIDWPVPRAITQDDARAYDLLADGYRSAAAALDLDPSAIRFVHAAARFGIMTHPNVNLTARDLCAALLDYARYHFGGQSNATLELARRRIRNSEDVGRIIYTLAAAGLLHPSEGDAQSDFDGLFTLENMFAVDL